VTATPDVYDALVASWKLIVVNMGLTEDQILDGPAVDYAGTEGVAVGATATDTTAEFLYPPSDLAGEGDAEQTTVPSLIWSGSGDTTFKPQRDRVKAIFAALRGDLARDRTIRGTVATAWITGGVVDQAQTGRGALVTCEFRIEFRRF
jgi:hypothetical protein